MASKLDGFKDVQLLIKNFNPCKPIAHRNSSLIEPPSSEKLSNLFLPQKQLKNEKQIDPYKGTEVTNKEFLQLSSIKFQNYKYLKQKFTPTFYKEIFASNNHLKQHSFIPKEKQIESIYNQRQSQLSSDEKYRLDKKTRIIDTRYQDSRNFKLIKTMGQNSERNMKIMQELKQNIRKLNETNTQKINFWVSPYMVRSEIKEKNPISSRANRRLNGLESCLRLYQELIRADVEKNVRLNILSSGSKRTCTPIEKNKIGGSQSFVKEDTKGWNGYRGIEDEKISFQSLKEHFNNVFNMKQWDRLFFGLKINPDENKLSFDQFLLFFRLFISKSASFDQKYEFFKKAFSYPFENVEDWKIEDIESILRSVRSERKDEFSINKEFIQIVSKQVLEMLHNRNRHRESLDEIIEIVFLRKK